MQQSIIRDLVRVFIFFCLKGLKGFRVSEFEEFFNGLKSSKVQKFKGSKVQRFLSVS